MNRKYGHFLISRSLISEEPTLVKRILSQCIVLRAEMLWETNSVEYFAHCHLFKELSEAEVVPEYSWQVFEDGWVEPREIVNGKTY